MEPLFFGDNEQLFGLLHRPFGTPRACGVVLCYPAWREYPNAHRTFRVLAHRLSRAGFITLRFDYYGTGDSAGGGDRGSIRKWIDDTRAAAGMLQDQGATRVALVGLRLGATLAALAGEGLDGVDAAVLWEPVVVGQAYLNEMRREHDEWLAHEYVTHRRSGVTVSPANELMGYPVGAEMLRDLEALDLADLRKAPARNVLILRESTEDDGELSQHFTALGAECARVIMPPSHVWTREVGMYQALVPAEVVSCTIDWLQRTLR